MTITEQPNFLEKCTGCMACYNSCPKKAIQMVMDTEGFYYPTIKQELCIHCGCCVKVCGIKSPCHTEELKREQYSFQGEALIRKNSSSGGAFYYLAQEVLKRGGIVFGAIFDNSNKEVCHDSTNNIELERIMRSKYVQSRIGETFCEVEECLKKNREVLFCGTPCQIEGLKLFLKNDYSRLITVDFVCHGVPSPGLFFDMLTDYEKQEKAHIKEVTFREKKLGWRKQVIRFYFENGSVIQETSANYYYYYLFLHNVSLRKSCYGCERPCRHISDITLFDYWAIKGDDDLGVSAVCVNTDKGREIFSTINGKGNLEKISEKVKLGPVFIPHSEQNLYKKRIKYRKQFFKYYQKDREKCLKKWYPHFVRKQQAKARIRGLLGKVKRKLLRRAATK